MKTLLLLALLGAGGAPTNMAATCVDRCAEKKVDCELTTDVDTCGFSERMCRRECAQTYSCWFDCSDAYRFCRQSNDRPLAECRGEKSVCEARCGLGVSLGQMTLE